MIASWCELKGTMNGVVATDQIPSPNSWRIIPGLGSDAQDRVVGPFPNGLSNDKALPHYLGYKMNLAFFP